MTAVVDAAAIREVLRTELFVELGPDDADLDLVEAQLIDSLGFTTLFVALEERFGITVEFDDMELDNFRTAARIERFVADKEARR